MNGKNSSAYMVFLKFFEEADTFRFGTRLGMDNLDEANPKKSKSYSNFCALASTTGHQHGMVAHGVSLHKASLFKATKSLITMSGNLRGVLGGTASPGVLSVPKPENEKSLRLRLKAQRLWEGNDPKANPKEIMQQEKEHKPRKMGTRTWIKGKKQANDSCGVRDGKFERKKVSYS
nr:hypothetical protein Iba_chr11aCG14790 [Ipomoea batatas]